MSGIVGGGHIPWSERTIRLAEWWRQWSTCSRLATGAVVVDPDWQVLVSGYNGAPRGLPHCADLPPEERLSDKNGHCLVCLHAEVNCILQAARLGVALRGASMYVTHRPCIRCARMLVQVGLGAVYYRTPYDSDAAFEAVEATFLGAGVALEYLDPDEAGGVTR